MEMHPLPFWPDEAPTPATHPPRSAPTPGTGRRPDQSEPPGYDGLFGSTQSAMAYCVEDEPVAPPPLVRLAPGLLRLSTGDVVRLDRGVLLGRAPNLSCDPTGSQRPRVIRMLSPDNDLSRNHAEVRLQGCQVMVRDLGSTNGTTLALTGQEPRRLLPNDWQALEPGTVVTMADEVSFTCEV